MKVATLADALGLLGERKMFTLSELVSAVAGKVKGSWWSHPKGGLIYQIGSALEDHADVLVVKLVEGRVTYVHRVLWPALLRVVTDAAWRKPRMAKLGADAKQVLAKVEKLGEVTPVAAKPRGELEKSLLVLSRSEHTSSGKHQTVLESWRHWMQRSGAKPSGSLDEALALLGV